MHLNCPFTWVHPQVSSGKGSYGLRVGKELGWRHVCGLFSPHLRRGLSPPCGQFVQNPDRGRIKFRQSVQRDTERPWGIIIANINWALMCQTQFISALDMTQSMWKRMFGGGEVPSIPHFKVHTICSGLGRWCLRASFVMVCWSAVSKSVSETRWRLEKESGGQTLHSTAGKLRPLLRGCLLPTLNTWEGFQGDTFICIPWSLGDTGNGCVMQA